MRVQYGLHYWGRFKDDAIAIMSKRSPERFLEFFKGLKRTAKPYDVVVERVARDNAPMLDVLLTLVRGARETRIAFDMYQKPSAQKIPLSACSGHNPNVLFSWPRSEVQRRRRLSQDERSFNANRLAFWKSLHDNFFPNDFIAFLYKYDGHQDIRRSVEGKSKTIYFVLRFHPAFFRSSLGKALRELRDDVYFRHLYATATGQDLPYFRVSWRNAASPMYSELVRLTH